MSAKKRYLALGGAAILLLSVAACGSNRDDDGDGGSGDGDSASAPITIGTTDTVTAVDPAGSYDLGSSTLQYNIFQTLVTIPAGENLPQGDAAESCTYDDPQTLTCTMKEGLTFSNGNELTASDVKFSLERSINIGDPNGAAIYLLGSIGTTGKDGVLKVDPDAIEVPDDTTVIFHLNKPDTTFQYVLTYPGSGAIVDEETAPPTEKMADADVIGSGPYEMADYKAGELATLEKNDAYQGDNEGKAPQIFVNYYQDPGALKLAVEDGDVDVAWRSLSPTDINDLEGNDAVTVAKGEGSEIRYWVWRVDDGAGTEAAVRQAAAQVMDRQSISDTAYDGTVDPLYSIVPPGLAGSTTAFQDKYGDPSVDAAKQILDDAGVSTPVKITMGYTPTHYGPNAIDEATELSRQLEESGLFTVELKSAEWEQYQTIYKEGAYDLWQLGWFPDFLDADNYLAPFIVDGGFFQNGYSNSEVNDLVAEEQGTTDQATREDVFGQLQTIVAEDVPLMPSWVGQNVAVYGAGVEGVEETLDASFIFRLWTLSKSE